MVGAGISVSAGIPDFRTPGTGLYDNLQQYGLPYPEAIFELDFFVNNPRPFYQLCQELWPGSYAPTPTHHFIRLLHDHGRLLRCYTQNIDSLESAAGIPTETIVAAHGNFDSAHVHLPPPVGARGSSVPIAEVEAAAKGGMEAWDALNAKHGGLVKPDIVFFGENLPRRFFELLMQDFPQCDLLLVMGTSLAVQPFASLIGHVRPGCPRMLINRDRVGEVPMRPFGGAGPFDFDSGRPTDLLFLGDCDVAAHGLVGRLGWEDVLAVCDEPGGEAELDRYAAVADRAEDSAANTAPRAPAGFTWAARLY
eukprot:3779415-Prymnesium_polylepis.3